MSRTPAKVTQADVARAIRAAQQCGAYAVQIRPDKSIHVVQDAPESPLAKAITTIDPFADHPGYVYFVAGGPFIKIGWSLLMKTRVASLQTGNPYKLELLGAIPARLIRSANCMNDLRNTVRRASGSRIAGNSAISLGR